MQSIVKQCKKLLTGLQASRDQSECEMHQTGLGAGKELVKERAQWDELLRMEATGKDADELLQDAVGASESNDAATEQAPAEN